jgi:DNA-binding Lrp family transcriptional regulator
MARKRTCSIGQIDEIDAKILRDLLIDGRKEFTEIANEAGVSKDIVWQHYTRMKRDAIIVGATVELNYPALGYAFSANFFVNTELQKQDAVAEGLRRIPGVYDAYRCGSSSELWAIGTFRDVNQLEDMKRRAKKIPGVLNLRTEILTGTRNNQHNLSVLNCARKTEITQERPFAKNGQREKKNGADAIDLQIIEKLAVNGRMSFNKIAKELSISVDTVARRYNRLKKDGIIKPLIQIDPTKLGYVAQAIINLAVRSSDDLPKVLDEVEKTPDVVGIFKSIGSFDLSFFVPVRSLEDLLAVQDKISHLPGVFKMETVSITQVTLLPFPKEHITNF